MSEEKEAAVKEKSSFDLKIIIIGLVFLIVAMGAQYFLMRSMFAPLLPKDDKKEAATKALDGTLISVGEFTTNINDVSGTRFLKVNVTLEASSSDKKASEEITKNLPVVKDSILNIIASKTYADWDVSNRNNIKLEIKKDLNTKFGYDVITNVYFEDLIMQ